MGLSSKQKPKDSMRKMMLMRIWIKTTNTYQLKLQIKHLSTTETSGDDSDDNDEDK